MTAVKAGRCAIGSYPYYRYSTEYFLDTACRLGFKQVELWAAAPQIDLLALTPEFCRTLRAQLKSRSLSACAVTPEQCNYPINLAAEDEPLRRRSIVFFKAGADLAAELECPWLLVSAGNGYYNHPVAPAKARCLDAIGQLALYAKERGVRLLFETLTPVSSNLVNTPWQVRQMIDQLPADTVYGMLDIGQMVVMGQTVAEYGEALGDKLAHVHLHDTGDACHMALGEGRLDLDSVLGEILALGYQGLFSLECNDARYRADPRRMDEKNAAWLKGHGWL